uniref:Uncharacterized protein n=1 Tax=Moniliophthora roreri TaxID=221103 RepID=A0A0W0F6F2_MONRR
MPAVLNIEYMAVF